MRAKKEHRKCLKVFLEIVGYNYRILMIKKMRLRLKEKNLMSNLVFQ